MFADLPSHADRRETELPWAPRIPAHWNIERAKQTMHALDVRSKTGHEELLTVSSSRGVVPRSTADVAMFQAASYVGHKLCWPNDLVINSLWAWSRGLGVSPYHGIISTAYGVYRLRPNAELLPQFVHSLVRSTPFQWELRVRSQGVWKSRLQMTDTRWLDAPLLLPPAEEQVAIVKYLAHANARIDKAITTKRRLIALLDEQEAAQVESSIRSMRSTRPMPMLGRAVRRIEQGTSPSPAEGDLADGQWAVLTLSAIRRGIFDRNARKPLELDFDVPESLRVENGELLMTRSNTRDRVGDVAVVRDARPRTIMSDLIYRLVLRDDLLAAEFASLVLRSPSLRAQIQMRARGSSDTMPKLTQGHIKALRIPLPDRGDQDAIVERTKVLLAKPVAARAQASREIELLEEFRTRMVADVVTGQVDVREIAASLPDVDPDVTPDDLANDAEPLDTAEVLDMMGVEARV